MLLHGSDSALQRNYLLCQTHKAQTLQLQLSWRTRRSRNSGQKFCTFREAVNMRGVHWQADACLCDINWLVNDGVTILLNIVGLFEANPLLLCERNQTIR